MPLQIRRGSTAQRLTITPLPGELVYDTTTGQLYVGDGATVGGTTTTGISLEDARDAAAGLLTSGIHSGITFTYNDALDRIDATVTIGGTGPFDGDINGSVFADDSSILVDGTGGGALRGRLISSGTDQTITATSGDINLNATYTGGYVIKTNTSVRLQYPDGLAPLTVFDGFSQSIHLNALNGSSLNLIKSRGTSTSPLVNQSPDVLGNLNFVGYDGSNYALAAAIYGQVDSAVVNPGQIPARIRVATSNGVSYSIKYEFDSEGTFKTNQIGSYSGGTIQSFANISLNSQNDLRFADADSSNYVAFQAPSTIAGNVTWTLPSTDGSNNQVLGTNGSGVLSWLSVSSLLPGSITATLTGSVLANDTSTIIDSATKNITGSAITSTNYVQLPVYVDEINRNTSIPFPSKGMISFVTNSDDGGPMLCINTDDTLPGWENVVTFDRLLSAIPSTLERDIKGSVFIDGSTRVIDGETGNITGSAITSTNYVQFPVYADVATRNATIPNPSPGMVTFVTDNGGGQPRLQVNTDGTNLGWVDLH